jgi:hypothetical protein
LVLGDICETSERGVEAEHRVAGSGAAADSIHDREPDGEHQRLEHADRHHADGRDRRDHDLDSIGRRQHAPGPGVD